jgi:hypothetical protein
VFFYHVFTFGKPAPVSALFQRYFRHVSECCVLLRKSI